MYNVITKYCITDSVTPITSFTRIIIGVVPVYMQLDTTRYPCIYDFAATT